VSSPRQILVSCGNLFRGPKIGTLYTGLPFRYFARACPQGIHSYCGSASRCSLEPSLTLGDGGRFPDSNAVIARPYSVLFVIFSVNSEVENALRRWDCGFDEVLPDHE
jgi:hypothetical protein